MSSVPLTAESVSRHDKAFLGHPIGLAYLAFTEAWERFSYYGMQTLLVLYMTKQLLLPGHVEHVAGFGAFRALLERTYGHALTTVALASAIFGLYTGARLSDADRRRAARRPLARPDAHRDARRAADGARAISSWPSTCQFLLALLCLLIGVGCFKGNLASQVGALYAPGDLRRADAFQIYYLCHQRRGDRRAAGHCGTLGEALRLALRLRRRRRRHADRACRSIAPAVAGCRRKVRARGRRPRPQVRLTATGVAHGAGADPAAAGAAPSAPWATSRSSTPTCCGCRITSTWCSSGIRCRRPG